MLMLHFLTRLARSAPQDEETETPASVVRLWPLVALGAIFIPWLLYPAVGDLLDIASVSTLWNGLWPLVIGAALALALRRWGARLPRVPEGDTVVAAEAAFRASFAWSAFFEKLDARLRRWPVAGLSLLAIALLLAQWPAMEIERPRRPFLSCLNCVQDQTLARLHGKQYFHLRLETIAVLMCRVG